MPAGSESTARDPEQSSREVLAEICIGFLDDSLAFAADYRKTGEARALHQFRVSLRKVESILRYSVFSGEVKSLSKIRRKTNEFRNLDVLLESESQHLDMAEEAEKTALEIVFDHLHRERETLLRNLPDILSEDVLERTFSGLKKTFVESRFQPGPDVNHISIARHMSDVNAQTEKEFLDLAEKIGMESSDLEFHRLRIRAKRIRYNAELLGPWNPRIETRISGEFSKDLQTLLGEFVDLCWQDEKIHQTAEESGIQDPLTRTTDYIRLRKEALQLEVVGLIEDSSSILTGV